VLEGEVADIPCKRAAVDTCVRALHGAKHVIDRLRVKNTEARQDLELKEDATGALLKESAFGDYTLIAEIANQTEPLRNKGPGNKEIVVAVFDGSITLSGQVESLTHRRLAEVLMWWIDGCRYVDNRLEVVPPEEDTDYEITDAVRIVLEKDPLVHASQLSAATAGGVVVLEGSVATREEKGLALQDVWCIPGVADVVDHVETRD
jgi:osmotically-inducible protein OsmY